mgnify:CR=1 FL=1
MSKTHMTADTLQRMIDIINEQRTWIMAKFNPRQIPYLRLIEGRITVTYSPSLDLMVMVATDRISAFDVVLPKGIPFKGQVLNQIAAAFLDATADIVPNWRVTTRTSLRKKSSARASSAPRTTRSWSATHEPSSSAARR